MGANAIAATSSSIYAHLHTIFANYCNSASILWAYTEKRQESVTQGLAAVVRANYSSYDYLIKPALFTATLSLKLNL